MPGSGTPSALDLLRRNPRLARLAAFPFDFDLERADHGEEVESASGAPLTGIAGDDTGGTYFRCADGGVLYADSDGRAGLIGRGVDDVLELVTGLPGRRDHLELPPDTGDDEVTSAARAHEADLRASYAPDLDAHRAELLAGLGLSPRPPAELFAEMHRALRPRGRRDRPRRTRPPPPHDGLGPPLRARPPPAPGPAPCGPLCGPELQGRRSGRPLRDRRDGRGTAHRRVSPRRGRRRRLITARAAPTGCRRRTPTPATR
ncbi:hypothetical protein ACF09H_33700 [Streptomyces sp. NPDC014983]|uniref:hypothetical protein n=1 Tax=Streptomyces sp. NPDC014983 TaxID=3364933 RepID=UPI003700C290